MSIRAPILLALVIWSVLGGSACSTKVKPYECAAFTREPTADAQQLWDCHLDIMVRVVKGKRFTVREFERAAEFFESLTGIPAAAEITPVGLVPGKGIRENLRRWEAWLEGHSIYIDPVDGRVKAREEISS